MRRHRVHVGGVLPGAAGAAVILDAPASHHLLTVCRHPRGAALVVTDGRGAEADAVLDGIEPDGRARLQLASAPRPVDDGPERHLVLALPKGPALEHALRMAVEVGATHIHPVITRRTVPNRDHGERWLRILRGAAEQAGRARIPALSPLAPLEQAIFRDWPPETIRRVAVPGAPIAPGVGHRPAALVVGPEGGLEPGEVDRLVAAGWEPVGLGAWTLRVDTAVAVGLALLG